MKLNTCWRVMIRYFQITFQPLFRLQGQAVGSIAGITRSDTPQTNVGQNETGEAPMVSTVCNCINIKDIQDHYNNQSRGKYGITASERSVANVTAALR